MARLSHPVEARTCQQCGATFEASSANSAPSVRAKWCDDCRWTKRGKPQIYVVTPERDEILRQRYDSTVRGRVAQIAAAVSWPRWKVQRRAAELGLVKPTSAHRAWTDAEVALLRRYAGQRPVAWMAVKLKRSRASVVEKIKALHISVAREREGYTLKELTLCFGVDHNAILRWIRRGWLCGRRRNGGSGPAFALDPWVFTDADLAAFMAEHPTAYELRRVDQTWFLGLIAPGWPAIQREARDAA